MFSNHMAVEYLLFSVCLFLGKLWKMVCEAVIQMGELKKKKCVISKSQLLKLSWFCQVAIMDIFSDVWF